MTEQAELHARRVHSVASAKFEPGVEFGPGAITRSWLRCLNEYGLDPSQRADPVFVGRGELQDRQERLADVLDVAKTEMANLYQQLAGSGYAIMLTDTDGVVLKYFCDPSFSHAESQTGFLQGAVWTERCQGTNGIGTCLVEKDAISISRTEHFLSRHIEICSAAAPIFNHRGDVVAVLNASGDAQREQRNARSLVLMSARMIENLVFRRQFRHECLVHFHSRAEFVGTLNEGVIAFDNAGRVIGATRPAYRQLGFRSAAEMSGLAMGELFNVPLAGLVGTSIKQAFKPSSVFEVRLGGRFFAVARASEMSGRCSRGNPLPRGAAPEPDSARHRHTALDDLQFGDAVMEHNIHAAKRVLERDVPILLYGETGTGKEMFAKAVHQSGSRASQPFIAINCASIPESLIESELFGYSGGAFTGAKREGQRGKVLQANGGTLFLDEIGDMPLLLQARLLRVLEEREIIPLGAENPVQVDIRLISATHCDLPKKIEKNEFREDLFYRLQGLTVSLPPLREREDRRALVAHLVAKESGQDQDVVVDQALGDLFDHYQWPGNIRQLRNAVRTMIAMRDSDVLTLADVPPELRKSMALSQQMLPPPPPPVVAPPAANGKLNALEQAEREALIHQLEEGVWNITVVARQLSMSRNTLYRRMQRLDIHPLERGQGLKGP